MMDKAYIETILVTSGVPPSSSVGQIRSVLETAGFTNSDIDSALVLLASDRTDDSLIRASAMRKISRSNQPLAPAEVSALLGVDLIVLEPMMKEHRKQSVTWGLSFLMSIVIIAIVALVAISVMYSHKISFFHNTAVAGE